MPAVFHGRPLALADQREPRAIDEELQRLLAGWGAECDVELLPTPGERGVVWGQQVEAHQPEHRCEEALGLAQREVKEEPQGEGGFDGHI